MWPPPRGAEHGLCTGGAGGGGGCGWGPSAPQGADAELQAHRSAAGTDGGPHCHRDPGEGQESRFLTLPLPQGGDEQIPKGPQAQASGGWCVTSEAPGASAASMCVTGACSREPGHRLGPSPLNFNTNKTQTLEKHENNSSNFFFQFFSKKTQESTKPTRNPKSKQRQI